MSKKIDSDSLKELQEQEKKKAAILHDLGLLDTQRHSLLHIYGEIVVKQEGAKKELEEKVEERQMEFVSNKKEILKRQTLIQDLNDNPDAINRIAREKFRLCNPGERV